MNFEVIFGHGEEKRIEGYSLCDEEFKLSKTKYPVTKTIENIGDDGEIHFVDMYYLSDFFDFLRLERVNPKFCVKSLRDLQNGI